MAPSGSNPSRTAPFFEKTCGCRRTSGFGYDPGFIPATMLDTVTSLVSRVVSCFTVC
jgi:hypothetical protein